jgi:hypothetical protein
MKPVFCFSLVTAFLFFVLPAASQSREEFNGPFSSWVSVQKFGAAGNGKTDDTRAIQKAIDNLFNPALQSNTGKEAYVVLYFPAGVYCISSTLTLRGKIGVSIIGADPKKTSIKWIGGDKDTMLWANGSAYFKIARLSWNGSGKKEIEAIGLHWKNAWREATSQSFAPCNIEISDNYFVGNLQTGISGGTIAGQDGTGANDSEISIKRCIFEDCTDAGIKIHGYNALDYWIWDCQFLNCKAGIDNSFGNYHVYRSYFNGSTASDLLNQHGYYTSARSCFSENSGTFSLDDARTCNPFKRVFQNNTIMSLKINCIIFHHTGKVSLYHNSFPKVQRKIVEENILRMGTWCPNSIFEVMSIKNKYEGSEPFLSVYPDRPPIIKYTSGDVYGPIGLNAAIAAAAFKKTMDPLPALVNRKVFEVPAGADSKALQNIINQAAALKGQRPIIHFGIGSWRLSETLVIPKGSDMQLIGEGLLYASVINRESRADFSKRPLILVEGPSYITVKDLQLGVETDKTISAAIVFKNIDQAASEAHLDQIYSTSDTSLVSENQDYLYIEKNNSFFTNGNIIKGGALTRQGKGTARVFCYGGQFSRLSVTNGATFVAKDCWWEGNDRYPLDLKGSGNISIDGAMIARANSDSTPTIRINEFSGKVNLMNMYILGAISVPKQASNLSLLLWNNNFFHKMAPYEYINQGANSQLALLGSNAQCTDKRPICVDVLSIPDKTYGIKDVNTFIGNNTTFDLNDKPLLFRNLPTSASNIYITRVSIGTTVKGIIFTK